MHVFSPKERKIFSQHMSINELLKPQHSHFTGAFCLLEPHAALSDDVVLWVSWQKLTFGKDIGISSMLGYKKQLFSRGPRPCQMILSCVCSQTPKRSASTRETGVQRKEHLNLLVSKLWQTSVRAGAFFTSPQMDRKDRTSAEEAPSERIHKYRRAFCLNIMRVYRKSKPALFVSGNA